MHRCLLSLNNKKKCLGQAVDWDEEGWFGSEDKVNDPTNSMMTGPVVHAMERRLWSELVLP